MAMLVAPSVGSVTSNRQALLTTAKPQTRKVLDRIDHEPGGLDVRRMITPLSLARDSHDLAYLVRALHGQSKTRPPGVEALVSAEAPSGDSARGPPSSDRGGGRRSSPARRG